jgi:tRNA G26 N,N-dimethylase Trm1
MINKILSQSSFWIVNKSVAKYLKCNDSAILLSVLIDANQYFEQRDQLEDEFFFYTSDTIEKNINISYHKQKKCINKLISAGFIDTKISGIPAKQHFKINENKILSFLNTVD